jgi:hypothetical protein
MYNIAKYMSINICGEDAKREAKQNAKKKKIDM